MKFDKSSAGVPCLLQVETVCHGQTRQTVEQVRVGRHLRAVMCISRETHLEVVLVQSRKNINKLFAAQQNRCN